jgi:hypothetical protein
MLTNVFGFASNTGIQNTFRLDVLLIIACLASFLAIRLAMSLVTCARVKERKQWDVEPAPVDNQSLIARLLSGCKEEPVSQSLLNDQVQRLLAEQSKTRR